MSIRTARFDHDTELALQHIKTISGMSISECLKAGIKALEKQLTLRPAKRPYDILKMLDLGKGDKNIPPALEAKEHLIAMLKKKHQQ